MKIASHPVLSNTAHARYLPPHWMTLHALTKLDESTLKAKIQDGTITPKTQRKDVAKLLRPEKVNTRLNRTTKTRHNYIRFLKSLNKQERYLELMDLQTAVGGLGITIAVTVPEEVLAA